MYAKTSNFRQEKMYISVDYVRYPQEVTLDEKIFALSQFNFACHRSDHKYTDSVSLTLRPKHPIINNTTKWGAVLQIFD